MTTPSRVLVAALIIVLAVSTSLSAQTRIVWNDLIRNASLDTTTLAFDGLTTLVVNTGIDEFKVSELPATSLENGRVIIDRKVEMMSPRIVSHAEDIPLIPGLDLKNLHFKKTVRIQLGRYPILIVNCVFEQGVEIMLGLLERAPQKTMQDIYCALEYNTIHGPASILANGYTSVGLRSNVFVSGDDGNPYSMFVGGGQMKAPYLRHVMDTLKIYGEKVKLLPDNFRIETDGANLIMDNNSISLPPRSNADILMRQAGRARISGNSFSSDVILRGTVTDDFIMTGNAFSAGISLYDVVIPPHHQIDWDGLEGKINVTAAMLIGFHDVPAEHHNRFTPLTTPTFDDSVEFDYLYRGRSGEELLNKKYFDKLIESYKLLYDSYRQKGNLESSNACFVAAKDLQGRRMKAIYDQEGGFKNYFSWKLNQLMKFYTNHATEPALALVISVYIILGFSLFYFFFPSEWDVESKGKLVRHYRDFIQKNEKGYVKPFLKMLLGFVVSFVNAITLSLNSFVTLGFGNIPTNGIARYVCIIQGFIGWFLLSIFTVALFNQVLF